MTATGWKTLIVSEHCKIGYSQGCLRIEKDDNTVDTYPVSEIKVLILESLQISVSVYLLNELRKEHVKVIFCDMSHNPASELTSYYDNYNQSGHIREQIAWNECDKDNKWKEIVTQKIKMQISLLKKLGKVVPESMYKCIDSIEPGDPTNREAVAASAYFTTLFGNSFSRTRIGEINSALNYGYSILLSMINRQVTAAGYITNVGLHHRSSENPYNLSSDLMEPFRPFIDEIVYNNVGEKFDKKYKGQLIASFYRDIKYRNQRMELTTAIDQFVNCSLKGIGNQVDGIQEVAFYG